MDTPPANEITRDQPPQPRQQDDNNTDITNDSFSSEPPIWASSSSETPADNLAPPPTYDPSAYSAPLNGTPAFKPRKSNRVSALAYSSDGTPPESQSGVPPGRSGSPALPPLPAGGPPGMKLPPPPMRTTETAAAPAPYAQDFRTAEIVNHWNDPPTQASLDTDPELAHKSRTPTSNVSDHLTFCRSLRRKRRTRRIQLMTLDRSRTC
jgi:hypothetical protein